MDGSYDDGDNGGQAAVLRTRLHRKTAAAESHRSRRITSPRKAIQRKLKIMIQQGKR